MFDSLRIKCTNCGHEIEFQSKAGDCTLHDYDIQGLPANIAMDLNGQSEECEGCGRLNKFRANTITQAWIE